MIEPRCKHNWVTPPECPECCADERDELKDKLAVAREALGLARHNYIRQHARNLDELQSMPTPYDAALASDGKK